MAGVTALRLVLGMCLISLARQQVQACIFGSQSGCSFPCNCDNDDVCNETSGACPDGCKQGQPRPVGNEALFDWRGPGCRIGNVAFGKPATQKGNAWDANNAVDGRLPPPDTSARCAHTEYRTQATAWWRVDLQKYYNISNITIFNRPTVGARTGHFNIRVGNNSDFIDDALCVYYEGPVPDGGNVTLSCTSRLVGRYVTMQRTGGGFEPHIINFCEMVVMGHESIQADCSRCVSSCDDIVGCRECSGFKPPHCTTPCEAGRYGINCESSCSEHHCKGGSTACNNMNGGCPDGCQDWYLGDQCITHINEPSLSNQTAISGTAVSSSQVRVTWGRDDDVIANLSQYYGYLVEYKNITDSNFLLGPNVSHLANEAEYSAIIRELIHNTVYTLRVSVYRQNGDLYAVSPWPTREVMVKTACRAPDPATILNITTGDVVDVEWQLAPSGCDNISSIHVLYRRVGTDEWTTHDIMDPTMSTSARIADVTGGQWEVQVRVVNNENIAYDSMSETFTMPATETATTTQKQVHQGSGNPTGVIAGAAAGGLLLLVIVVAIVVVCLRRRSKRHSNTKGEDNMAAAHHLSEVSVDKPVGVVEPVNKASLAYEPTELSGPSSAASSAAAAPSASAAAASAAAASASAASAAAASMRIQGTTRPPPESKPDFRPPGSDHQLHVPQPAVSSSRTTLGSPLNAPISITQLKAHINDLSQPIPKEHVQKTKDGKKDIIDGFGREFDDLPGADFKTREVGRSQANMAKNRFKNIQPYDDSRVKIEAIDELSQLDYINASYITGYPKNSNHYIAAQGPTEDTVVAFWFMIWQQGSNRIVMLTRPNEGGKKKCVVYWPDDKDKEDVKVCGPFRISLVATEVHADYAYRRLRLRYKDEVSEIHQLHFLAWEDKKCPENNFPLLAFRGRVLKLPCDVTGPLVVHCSAGVGRTGTYIGLDYLLNQAKCEGRVDVFVCVYRLRTQRMYMVQTENQYAFLYNAVLEGIETRIGEIEVPSAQFIARYDTIFQETAYSNQNPLQEQYEVMCNYKPEAAPGAASDDTNVGKNRFHDIVPDDKHRPRLSTPYSHGNDYINAVFVDNYESRNSTILTQTPLPNTVVDFWRLVYDHNCSCIVMLHDTYSSDETFGNYFPSEEGDNEKYGPVQVENVSSERLGSPKMIIRTFCVTTSRRLIGDAPLTVRQFQLLGSGNKERIPSQPKDFIALTEKVDEWRRHQTSGVTVVHCIDGAERSGLFATGSYMLDILKAEQEVAVLLASRYVTSRRPQAVQTLEHYQFMFELAKCYLADFHTYGNV